MFAWNSNSVHRLGRGASASAGIALIAAIIVSICPTSVQGQWTSQQFLVDPSDQNRDIKNGRIIGAAGGGFHALYTAGGVGLRYRRILPGGPLPAVTVTDTFLYNADFAEAGNGELHVVFESWTDPDPPQVGWCRSANGGASFSPYVRISNSGAGAKFPFVVPFGASNAADAVMAYQDADDNQMKYQRWNGGSWSPSSAQNFATCDTAYQATGMCRSPVDGSVYRTYGRMIGGLWSVCYRRYNGSGWDNEVVVSQEPTFFAWPYIAVNNAGVIMVFWDRDEVCYSRWFTPGQGWSAIKAIDNKGIHGHMAWVPGTNRFVCVNTGNQNRVQVRQWVDGQWLASTNVSPSSGFTPDSRIGASVDGTICAIWENWDTGGPRWYYSMLLVPRIEVNPASIVRSQNIGTNRPNDSFTISIITNAGAGNINYTVSDNVPWLSVTPTSGTSSGGDIAATIIYDTAGLQRGVYDATITVSSPNVLNSPRSVSLRLTVNSVRPDFDGDGDVDQSDFGHLQSCYTGPAVSQTLPACQNARLDADEDVDLNDFGIFQSCHSGAGVIANPNCAG